MLEHCEVHGGVEVCVNKSSRKDESQTFNHTQSKDESLSLIHDDDDDDDLLLLLFFFFFFVCADVFDCSVGSVCLIQ